MIERHGDILVVRDDLLKGGTKSRYLARLFEAHDEVVYASPAWGGAQLALAYCAQQSGKRATIFVAKRKEASPRTLEARAAGARVFQVPHGYLSNVQAKAKMYARDHGAFYVEFGGESEEALDAIASAAGQMFIQAKTACNEGLITQVWCAAGSGVLIRGLQRGWDKTTTLTHDLQPRPTFIAVQIGHKLMPEDVGGASIMEYPYPFEKVCKHPVPFPSCPNYDAKAWQFCNQHGIGTRIFWNVMGGSPTPFANEKPNPSADRVADV